MADPNPRPFGEPAVQTAALVTDLPIAGLAPAQVIHGRSLAATAAGQVLLSSCSADDRDMPTVRRSIAVLRSALRLQVRGEVVRATALVAEAEPLLEQLARRLPGAEVRGGELRAPVAAGGTAPGLDDARILAAPSLLDAVRATAGLVADGRPDAGLPPGLFGAFGYELVDRFEDLGPRKPDPLDEPDLELVLGLDSVVYDHRRGRVQVITRGLPWEPVSTARARHAAALAELHRPAVAGPPEAGRGAAEPAAARPEAPDAGFLEGVRTLREHIARGDVFQAVLSRAVTMPAPASSLHLFAVLSAREPAPYMFHLAMERGAFLGASPETFLRVEDGIVEIRPIAGTAARGLCPQGGIDRDRDERLALALLFDPKERAEHVMLLDLARNDVARVSVPGTTQVTQQFAIEKYSRVQHLVSRVQGRLRPGLDALHAYRAAANMGTLTGAPKARAMELVRGLEPVARGLYGGAVGYLLQDGRLDTCIAIRSLRVIDGLCRAQAGAGIVWGSVPERELEETEHKLRALREAVGAALAAANAPSEVTS